MTKTEFRQRRSLPRLKSFDYAGPYAYSVSCCTRERRPHLSHKDTIDVILCYLEEVSAQFRFSVYAYCFMPDHLHLLVVGTENCSLTKFMTLFKQRTNYAFKSEHGDPLWQRSYYDHILRREEALRDVALYIFENPVRKGLVANYRDYPFSGSLVFDAKEID